jgi:dTDP-4-dehydrorhamnose reductase
MIILITGSNGLLGQKLVYNLLSSQDDTKDIQIVATSRGENRLKEQKGYQYCSLDITDESEVLRLFGRIMPDVVIHTAAMTNVDACETDKENCKKNNVDAVAYIVNTLEKLSKHHPGYNPHLVHVSTDFIFDGLNGPYDEQAEANPVSYYGWSKNEAEKIVMNSSLDWAIARTIIVYGLVDNMSRSNLVLWAVNALSKNESINVVNDQFRSPTLAEDLAEGCLLIAQKRAKGVFNISGEGVHSILDLVYQVADVWNLPKENIRPISSESLNQPAKRPPRTGFILDKAKQQLGYRPKNFKEGLMFLKQQLETVH